MPISGTTKLTEDVVSRKPRYRQFIAWISLENIANPEYGIITAAESVAILNTEYREYKVVGAPVFIGRHTAISNAVGVLYLLELLNVE